MNYYIANSMTLILQCYKGLVRLHQTLFPSPLQFLNIVLTPARLLGAFFSKLAIIDRIIRNCLVIKVVLILLLHEMHVSLIFFCSTMFYLFLSCQLFRRVIDFGSAMDEYTVNHLYTSLGPSRYFICLGNFISLPCQKSFTSYHVQVRILYSNIFHQIA